MRQSIRLGSFAGIPVGINWSVLVIFGLVAWQLAAIVFPAAYGGGARPAYWVAAVIAALVFLASLLAHEVSHAVVARHNDVGVRSITLWLFGGVAQLEGEAHTPGADFRIAAVGPATSFLLVGLFACTELLLRLGGVQGLPVDVASWLWKINLLLALFNVMPAAPLDGGRILRSALWGHWHDRRRAALAAARAGRGFGILLVVIGVLLVPGYGLSGLWPALLGWFLYSAAGAEEHYNQLRGDLARLPAGQVMAPRPPAVPWSWSVADLLSRQLWHYRGDAIAVVDERGWLAGVVTIDAVRRVPPERQHDTVLSAIAIAVAGLAVARPEEPMETVLERMAGAGGKPVVVLDADNRLAGLITGGDVERAAAYAHLHPSIGSGG